MLECDAILRAQREQLNIEAPRNEAQRMMNNKKATAKLDKTQASLYKSISNKKMFGGGYKAAEKVFVYHTNAKIQANLEELDKEKKTDAGRPCISRFNPRSTLFYRTLNKLLLHLNQPLTISPVYYLRHL